MPNPNTGEVNPRLEPTGPGPVDDNGSDRLTSPTAQKIPAGDVGSNKETEGGSENQEQTRKTRSAKNNDEGQDTAAKK
ncbi:hypothetical protein CKM354_000997700 [Cercospora kikuchii]|uniref:Uncharacterized protein n=1 Tax=Cercospora kikuchii TaxID=84275 RepID=A0A9P3CLU4_9PEZI|nr:uncharacterized protein CKM354_000997700 [Cercospora kikuchii]GIZ46869.1 hypothetical protein CKM354_000997700 [Cercospora kikuchii]